MSSIQVEVYEAFRSLNVDDDKALKAAAVLGRSSDEVGALRTDMNARFAKVDVGLATIRGELVTMRWLGGLILAMLTTVLFRVFTH